MQCSARTYYVLSAATGRVLHASRVRHFCCGTDVADFDHYRLYTLLTARASDPRSAAQIPELRALDLHRSVEVGRLALPGLHAGSWQTTRQIDGGPLLRAWNPALALSPDGTHLAIVDPGTEQLMVLHHAPSALKQLGNVLGLVPETAYAKGAEGSA